MRWASTREPDSPSTRASRPRRASSCRRPCEIAPTLRPPTRPTGTRICATPTRRDEWRAPTPKSRRTAAPRYFAARRFASRAPTTHGSNAMSACSATACSLATRSTAARRSSRRFAAGLTPLRTAAVASRSPTGFRAGHPTATGSRCTAFRPHRRRRRSPRSSIYCCSYRSRAFRSSPRCLARWSSSPGACWLQLRDTLAALRVEERVERLRARFGEAQELVAGTRGVLIDSRRRNLQRTLRNLAATLDLLEDSGALAAMGAIKHSA